MTDLASLAPGHTVFGKPQLRVDGRDKVTGRAAYPSDDTAGRPVWAFLVTSTIARGRIDSFDLSEALAMEGVLEILTHENAGGEADPPAPQDSGSPTTTMQDARIWHDGQIIGVVLADTFEIARDAAFRVKVGYAADAPSATFGSAGADEERVHPDTPYDTDIGNVDAALAGAHATVDAVYGTPTQHHNPIELFTTTCAWTNDELTIWEPSQFVHGLRNSVAKQLRMPPDHVRVISTFIGGAFGSKGSATARTAWIAVAARRLGRPVKLVATRDQSFTIATYRAETRHHLQLAASGDGKLTALRHEGWELTSRPSMYNVSGTSTTSRMYQCPNIQTRVSVVHADRNTPGFMRAPPDTPYMFPLECAMDELAVQLGMDPIELRRVNDTPVDPVNGLPWSSRHLMTCFDQGAKRFGWATRNPAPGSMTDGDWLIGWGCASAAYPSNIAATASRVTLRATGKARVQVAGHDIGTGAYTVVAMTAAEQLGLPVDAITVEMGDTDLPPASLAAGSSHSATLVHAVTKACAALRHRLAQAAVNDAESPLAGGDAESLVLRDGRLCEPFGRSEPMADAMQRISTGAMEAYAEHIPDGLPPEAMANLYQGEAPILRGSSRKDVTAYAFGAQFVEIRIHRRTREIRVHRMVGAFACGTLINPLTARSQYLGGMIWGIGAALLEKTDTDLRHARYINDNLAEYHVPVNADVRHIDVIMIAEPDAAVNPQGIKGIGEIGIVGVNAAIANAVFHATGKRIRHLPIRIEDVLD